MGRIRFLLFIACCLLVSACTMTIALNGRGIFITWPHVEASVTPTVSIDPTPTQERGDVVDSTPVIVPTVQPFPALLPSSNNLNVRTCPGLGCEVLGVIGQTDCLAFDHRAFQVANGIVWVQPQGSEFGEGVWVAFKNVGANGLQYARAYGDFPVHDEITIPLP